MMKQITKSAAKGIKSVLEMVLRTEANTASCVLMYQPKEPKEIVKYKKNK